MNVNDGGDMDQTLKLKILCMGRKPTMQLFIGIFVGVVVREIVVLPPERIKMI